MATLAVYLHAIDPYALKLWEGGPVRWYGLSYLVGFLVAYFLLRRVARAGVSSLSGSAIGDFLVAIAIGVVVGGRLGYVLFYRPQMLWTFSDQLPYWDLLAINKGGMASHGGMIGAVVGCLWYARRARGGPHSGLHLLDLVAFATPPGLFFGRVANFINGELIGRPCSPHLPWAVKFPQEMFSWSYQQLAELKEAVGRGGAAWSGDIARIIERLHSGDAELIGVVEPLLVARHPSQLYQALLEGLVLFAVLCFVWSRPRTPGLLAAVFCCVYSLLRMAGECFRQPDAHIGFQSLGLTRGQWLSVLLLAVGVVMFGVLARRRGAVMGGWRSWPAGDRNGALTGQNPSRRS